MLTEESRKQGAIQKLYAAKALDVKVNSGLEKLIQGIEKSERMGKEEETSRRFTLYVSVRLGRDWNWSPRMAGN
jgi:hypothetical protein